jgi:large subunit ribosomal protein L21
MYAIIKTSGKQYKVEVGSVIEVNRVKADADSTIELEDSVLLVSDGDKLTVGSPLVKGAKVVLKVIEHFRGKKLIAFKMKRRKRYRLTKGHRQELTKVEVKEIIL